MLMRDHAELAIVSCPDPTPSEREGLVLTSEFLVVLSQHAYGNFVITIFLLPMANHLSTVGRITISSTPSSRVRRPGGWGDKIS